MTIDFFALIPFAIGVLFKLFGYTDERAKYIYDQYLFPLAWGGLPFYFAWVSGFSVTDSAITGIGLGFMLGASGRIINVKSENKIERGTQVISTSDLNRRVRESKVEAHARIGGAAIPEHVMPQGLLLSGSPGTGKSLSFLQLMSSARERGHKAVVCDLGGEFAQRLFRPGKDVILNPFDTRQPEGGWSPFAEIRSSFHCARAAGALVQVGDGEESETWNGSARTLLQVGLEGLFERGPEHCTNGMLLYMCLAAPQEELKDLAAGSPAAPWFEAGAERFLSSVKATLVRQLQPLMYLDPSAGAGAFSIRKWMDQPDDSWLFLTYRDDQLASLKPLLAAMLDTACGAILSRSSAAPAPTWVFVDEFASLGRVNSLVDLAAKGRKYGARLALGLQSISQARQNLGKDAAQSLLACLGTWLTLRPADAETADYMSRFLGDEEARRKVASGGEGATQTGTLTRQQNAHQNWTEQVTRQRAILPSELQSLADRQGILNIAGPLPPALVEIPICKLRHTQPAFVAARARPSRIERPAILDSVTPSKPGTETQLIPPRPAPDPFANLGG